MTLEESGNVNVFLVTNKLHLHPYARRDNCRSSLLHISLRLLLHASSPIRLIGTNQHHININVFIIDASSSSFSFLGNFSSRSYLFPRILFLSFCFSYYLEHSYFLQHHAPLWLQFFFLLVFGTLFLFYYRMNHLASVVSCCPHPRTFRPPSSSGHPAEHRLHPSW